MAYKKLTPTVNTADEQQDVILVDNDLDSDLDNDITLDEQDNSDSTEDIKIVEDDETPQITEESKQDEVVPIVVEDETPIVITDTIEEDTESKEDEITIVDVVNKPVEPKKVKVKLKINHKCFIGGEWYYFTKGEVCNVPENVKNILVEADLLLPL
jgi:hypothetical protein